MKKLLCYLKDYRKESIFGPLFKLLEALLELFVPLVVAAIIDNGIGTGDRGYIIKMCLVLVILGLVGLAFSVTAQFFAAKAAVGFVKQVRHALFSHIQTLSYSELDTQGTSTLITRLTSDMNQVQNGINLTLRLLLRSPFVVIGAMIMAFTIDVKAALVFAVGIPILAVVVFGIMLVCIPLYRKVQSRLDGVTGMTRENLTGVRVLRAFCKEEEQKEKFQKRNQQLTDIQKFVGRISALLNPVTYIIINIAIIVLIWVGALRVDMGILTQGAVVALYNYMSQILTELIKLANLIINITKAVACGNRIQAVLEVEPSISNERHFDNLPEKMALSTDEDHPEEFLDENHSECSLGEYEKSEKSDTVPEMQVSREEAIQEAPEREELIWETSQNEIPIPAVEYQEVSLCYPNASEDALENISFSVEAGQTVGVIGGTGSGKTSLINLIPRFYDCTKGSIRIDGKDVRDYNLTELRERIGVVPQKAVLFAGTIRENMQWGDAQASDEEIYQALEIAQAREIVEGKENGLDSVVEQGGKNLSGGQRQRFTIARALVKKPDILILDDSSSALDLATDAALRHAIECMEKKPTLFIVSQRTSAIQKADKIVVLDDGKTVGIGTHEQLLESCPVYQEIYESQFKRSGEEVSA